MTDNNKIKINDITGVILAGGRAKRMGGQDKGLINVDGRAMVEIIIEQFSPQVKNILINANRNVEQYKKFNHPVISDDDSTEFHGPLAGMLSALKSCTTKYILSVPCDSPFFPSKLSTRLLSELINANADIAVVHDGNRMQPVFALIKKELTNSLENYINNGDRKIDLWYQQHHTILVDFSDYSDIALNINTPEELQQLKHKLTEYKKVC